MAHICADGHFYGAVRLLFFSSGAATDLIHFHCIENTHVPWKKVRIFGTKEVKMYTFSFLDKSLL